MWERRGRGHVCWLELQRGGGILVALVLGDCCMLGAEDGDNAVSVVTSLISAMRPLASDQALHRGLATSGGGPTFLGKGPPDCVVGPFGSVPCRCFQQGEREEKDQSGKSLTKMGGDPDKMSINVFGAQTSGICKSGRQKRICLICSDKCSENKSEQIGTNQGNPENKVRKSEQIGRKRGIGTNRNKLGWPPSADPKLEAPIAIPDPPRPPTGVIFGLMLENVRTDSSNAAKVCRDAMRWISGRPSLCYFALSREVLNGVGADRVGVKFSMFPVNCSCSLLSSKNEGKKTINQKRLEEKQKIKNSKRDIPSSPI